MLNNNWNKPTKKYKDEDLIHLSLQALRIHIADHQSVGWFSCSQILHTIHLVLILKWKPSVCFCRPPLTIAGWYVWEVSWGIIAPWARTRAWQPRGQRTQDGACDKLICDDLSSERRECDIYCYLVLSKCQHPVAILFHWSPYFQYLLTIVTINKSQCRLFVTI